MLKMSAPMLVYSSSRNQSFERIDTGYTCRDLRSKQYNLLHQPPRVESLNAVPGQLTLYCLVETLCTEMLQPIKTDVMQHLVHAWALAMKQLGVRSVNVVKLFRPLSFSSRLL